MIRSLRFQYSGLSPALPEQIAADIRAELRRKDAQISLIDRSCLQLRVRAKNYKELLVVQMSEPEVKRDWLTDVRLAKLALDRDNNPAWNIASEVGCPLPNQMTIGHHSSASGNPPPPFSGICQQRVPLFVKSLAIFATTDCSQLTCALFYQLPLPAALANTPAALLGAAGAASCGVLWICNVNQSGSQLGALATNGDDVHLIHSYELCESHVTCLEHVHAYSVWIGLRQGRVIVIDGTSPSEWRQLAALEVAGEVVCMKHVRQHVFVGLRTGVVTVFDIQDYDEPIIITLSQQPVTCILAVHDEVFACSGDKIWVINAQCQVCRSYSLCSSTSSSSSSSPIRSTSLEMDAAIESNLSAANAVTSAAGNVSPNEHSSGMISSDPPRPALLAHCGIGLWVSLIDSPIVKLYHTETFKHLQDINVASNVKRVLQEPSDVPIVVTSMLATRGLLWIGTSVGFVLTLSLPRLQGVPLVSGCLNVSLHRHLGPVSILLSLTPAAHANSVGAGRNGGRASASAVGASGHDGNTNGLAGETLESKGTDVESIYGLYADLMKVDDYMGTETARSSASTASTAIVSNVSAPSAASTLASNAVAGSAMQAGVAGAPSGANSTTAGRIAWELSNMALSDDSTSESASSGRIYQDGSRTAAAGPVSTGNGANPHSPVDAHGHDPKNGKTDDRSIYEARRAMSSANGFHSMHQPTSANSNTPSHLAGNGNVSSTTPFTNSASATNLRSQSVNSNGAGAAGGSSIYESSGVANVPLGLANPAPTATAANLKTALLITGGNGFKRGSANKPYSSQHAHCIIWEYKL